MGESAYRSSIKGTPANIRVTSNGLQAVLN
jgi:hypothetical protein